MRVFVPKGKNQWFVSNEITSENTYIAFFGFSVLGWEVVFYEEKPPTGILKEDVVIGWISQVHAGFKNIGIEPPAALDYPDEIQKYLNRKIWQGSLHNIYTDESLWPVFVKPVKGKQFDGKLITSLKDLTGLGSQEDRAIWCSEPVEFISEWRCFVLYGKLIDSRNYKGDFKISPDFNIIESCINDYGVTKSGITSLIEVNDAFALGNYGLNHLKYAKMISARWSEIVGIPDPCLF